MTNILVVYAYNHYRVKSTVVDHLQMFEGLPGVRVFYWNVHSQPRPDHLRRLPIHLVVYQYALFGFRFSAQFQDYLARLRPLKDWGAVQVALPQDEYYRTVELEAFFNGFGVDHVYSCLPPATWPKLYAGLRRETRLHLALTGYLSPKRVREIAKIARENIPRDLDLGYRTWRVAAWLGSHGWLKAHLGDVFAQAAPAAGLKADISLDPKDIFYGNDWYRFMLRCKYMIGMEGGVSLLDRDGELRKVVDAFAREHPGAGFEEIETACFPGRDMEIEGFALSPRHLECCATHTAQVLVEGDYGGILKPWEHYIPLKRDLSNLDEVLALMKEDKLREDMTRRAWRDVVASGQNTYHAFAGQLLADTLGRKPKFALPNPWAGALALHNHAAYWWSWRRFYVVETWSKYKWIPVALWGNLKVALFILFFRLLPPPGKALYCHLKYTRRGLEIPPPPPRGTLRRKIRSGLRVLPYLLRGQSPP